MHVPDWKIEPPQPDSRMLDHWNQIEEIGYTTFLGVEENRTISLQDIDVDFTQSPEYDEMRELQRNLQHDKAGCLANSWCQNRLEDLMQEAARDYYEL